MIVRTHTHTKGTFGNYNNNENCSSVESPPLLAAYIDHHHNESRKGELLEEKLRYIPLIASFFSIRSMYLLSGNADLINEPYYSHFFFFFICACMSFFVVTCWIK